MWYLTSENESRIIYVCENKDVTIGRSIDAQNSNFAVPDDPSLSRKHACLSIQDGELVVRDLSSKYGTYINNNIEKVDSDVDHILHSGDVVKFGKIHCTWKVNEIQFITCTSTLKGENLQSLRVNLSKLGGVLKNDWDDMCYYLTMPAITLTIKVVLALVQGSHIVTTEFWKKCSEAVINNGPLPSPKDHLPQIVESTLNKEVVSFLPNIQRQTLFSGNKFVFFSKRQLDMYRIVLLKSGATTLLLSQCSMTKSELCEPNVIVIQYNITSTTQETQAQKEQISNIITYLKSKKKRLIPDPEIGLAILYCNTNKYCNPDFNFSSEVIKNLPANAVKSNVLALETQDSLIDVNKRDNVVINESLSKSSDLISSGKRKLSYEDQTNNASKKMHMDSSSNNDPKKRAADDDLSHNAKKMAFGNDDDDFFNFLSQDSNKNNESNKKLNLAKPNKRKTVDEDDDDLFNSLETKKPCTQNEQDSLDDINEVLPPKKIDHLDDVKVEELRGAKLQELIELNSKIVHTEIVKKEDHNISELDSEFNNIDLGSTTIIVRNDLIIKKEPLEIKLNNSGVKNFKKFKKVWPVNMQITIV